MTSENKALKFDFSKQKKASENKALKFDFSKKKKGLTFL